MCLRKVVCDGVQSAVAWPKQSKRIVHDCDSYLGFDSTRRQG
jgi:hypothetical protein